MSQKFTQAFKIQAVEKALSRAERISVLEIAESLGVGYSTLQKWIVKSKNHEFESSEPMTKGVKKKFWEKILGTQYLIDV